MSVVGFSFRSLPLAMGISLFLNAAGCVSVPAPSYVTLDMNPSGKIPNLPCNIELVQVRASEALRQDRVLIQATPTEITYYRLWRWAAEPESLVGEKLRCEFGPAVPDRPSLLLKARLSSFAQVDRSTGSFALLRATVEFCSSEPSGELLTTKVYELEVPCAEPTAPGLARALSRACETLAVRVAADAQKLFQAAGKDTQQKSAE